ncbi:MAG TPA: FAD-dependent oxidoreductase [Pilimelia sp.]|nr:FAD-dependent oxidoreductase [Pilimelia sp.]
MGEPLLLVVDDDRDTLDALTGALRRRYGADYRVVGEASATQALRTLEDLRASGAAVAVIVADQWMPELTGCDFLVRAHALHPRARRVLLYDAFDREAARLLSSGVILGRVDSWLFKPWDPAEKRLYSRVSEMLADWTEGTGHGAFHAVRVVAEPWTPRAHEMRDLFERNGIPAELLPPGSAEGQRLLARSGHTTARLPVVEFFDGRILVDPSNAEVAEALQVQTRPSADRYDLVVVGAGPAGLSAAVYGASEGLDTVMIESEAFGGQAGTSSLIRNYLGFPRGVSGQELAVRASEQAAMFGAEFVFARAASLRTDGSDIILTLADGSSVVSRTLLLSVGVEYRRLGAPGVDELIGAGVFYGAATSEAPAVRGEQAFVVGAGNSAGQAAIHLAKYAEQVTIVVRGQGLSSSMSDYLIKQIDTTPNVRVRPGTTVEAAGGTGRLEYLELSDRVTGRTETVPAGALFILIGAQPHTAWLPGALARDARGFVLTGRNLLGHPDWPLRRDPLPLETSIPGVFAAGDVRHGSIKRVASAAGEGAIAIQNVHEYLATREERS